MAVEASLDLVIHKVKNLVTEESKTLKKIKNEVEEVLKKLNPSHDGDHQDQINKELQFLAKAYRVGDAIESFDVAETRLRRRGFAKKHNLLIRNEFKLCWNVPHEVDISRLKLEMQRVSKEIQTWKDGTHACSRSLWWHEQPWQEKIIYKRDTRTLQDHLTNNRKPLEIISVFGDDGIGITSHANTIYKNLKANKEFTSRALVDVKTKWSVEQLVMAILAKMTGDKVKEKLENDVLKGRLHRFLKDKKYLIIINDVKSLKLLEDLRGALPDAYKGSKVVITTSNKEVASFADASSRYHFKQRHMEGSLEFFITNTRGEKASPFLPDIMARMKQTIQDSCHGTEQRIAMLAGMLSTRGEIYDEWSEVFKKLEVATKSPSFDVLVFCYNDVPKHLKPCLLYLTLFQRESEIPVRRLFGLWLAEGFTNPSSEAAVEGYLEDLVKRNMVEITKRRFDGSSKKCRLIGILHDILLPMALNIGLFHLHQKSTEHINTTSEYQFGVRRVVEYTSIKKYYTSEAFNHNIQSYISISGRREDMPAKVGNFLKKITGVRGFGLLKVLDLEGAYLPRLPENVGNLSQLRYLGLRSTFLDSLPSSLGGLLYLETLDLKHTRITTLPSSIWKLERLHHLYLNDARLDMSAQSTKHRGPSQLKTLQGLFIDEKTARKIGLMLRTITNLQKLDITRQPTSKTTHTKTTTTTTTTTYEEIGSWILSLCSLQSLTLRSKSNLGRPSELIVKPLSCLGNLSQLYLVGHLRESLSWYQIPPGLKVLTLSVSKLGEDPMPTLSQLPNLTVLRLLGSSYVGEEMRCPENGFPVLQVLILWKLEELKSLSVHEGAMQKLQTMEIRGCRKLKEFPLSLLQKQSFYNLTLANMPKPFATAAKKKKKSHTKIVEMKQDL